MDPDNDSDDSDDEVDARSLCIGKPANRNKVMPGAAIQSISKANRAMTLASQKALKAQAAAAKAVEAADTARKRVYEDIATAGISKRATASTRTSTKSFAAKDPVLALAALECVDIDTHTTAHEFAELGVAVFKFSVRTLSAKLTEPPGESQTALFSSVKSSALMAAKTVGYIFDLAVELGISNPEKYAEASRFIDWHGPQSILKGRETRGAGIVMYSESARELIKVALVTAKDRVGARVQASAKYESEMAATAAAAARSAAGDFV